MHVYIRRKNNRMEEVDGNDKSKKRKKTCERSQCNLVINIDLESFVMRYNAFFLPINLLDQCFRKNWIDIVERIIEWKKKKEKKCKIRTKSIDAI